MNNLISSVHRRDVRDIIIHPSGSRSFITVDPVTALAMQIPLPTLAGIVVTESGLVVIGPRDLLHACRDPVPTG